MAPFGLRIQISNISAAGIQKLHSFIQKLDSEGACCIPVEIVFVDGGNETSRGVAFAEFQELVKWNVSVTAAVSREEGTWQLVAESESVQGIEVFVATLIYEFFPFPCLTGVYINTEVGVQIAGSMLKIGRAHV